MNDDKPRLPDNTAANIVKGIIMLLVSLFIASVSYSFAGDVFPGDPVKQFFALALTDVSVFGWWLLITYGNPNPTQRTIAWLLFGLSLLGMGMITAAETVKSTLGTASLDMQTLQAAGQWSIVIMSLAQVAGGYLYMAQSDHVKERAEVVRELREISQHERAMREDKRIAQQAMQRAADAHMIAALQEETPRLARQLGGEKLNSYIRTIGADVPPVMMHGLNGDSPNEHAGNPPF